MKRIVLTAAMLFLASHDLVRADEKFENTAVRFEQNVTDKDAEVVFEAMTAAVGMANLKVVGPDGRTVVDFKSPDSKLGIRHFKLESPEPKNVSSVQADFPEGAYTFTGTTVTGVKLHGKATLSHKLPDPVSIVRPRPEEQGVPVNGLQIKWSAARNVVSVVVVIEQEKTGRKLAANLSGTATTFAMPDGFLLPRTEYKLAIGTVSREGNTSLVETEFTTGGKK